MPEEQDNTSGQKTDSLYITPGGRIYWNQPPFDKCFTHGTGSGLLAMATAEWPAGSGAAAYFLRKISRNALTRFAHSCAEDNSDTQKNLQSILPTAKEIDDILTQIPPLKGMEYLTRAIVLDWHKNLLAHISMELGQRTLSAAEWLQKLGEPWNRIGRVFFHLAENRDDTTGTRPFAFMATFAHKSSVNGELSHLPLGKAIQLYQDDHRALLALLQPLKETAQKVPFVKQLLESKNIYNPMLWDAQTAQAFLRSIPLIEESGIIVRIVNLWKKPPLKLQLTVTAEEQDEDHKEQTRFSIHSILNFSVAVCLGGQKLSPEELEAILNHGGGLIQFKGSWIDAEPSKIRQLLDQWQKASHMMNRFGIPLVQGLRLLITGKNAALPPLPPIDENCQFAMGKKLGEHLQTLDQNDSDLNISPSILSILRPYQKMGAAFLHKTTAAGFGACLADDMGLGKTLQGLAWLSHLKTSGELSDMPALIIAPTSLLGNWQDEILKFTPDLKAGILHPSNLTAKEWRTITHYPSHWLKRHNIVLTSYGMATRLEWLSGITFPVLIMDEAQAVKNPQSQRTEAVKKIKANRKVALSGTPVENSLMELWSLMDVLTPGLLGTQNEFREMVKNMGDDFSPLRKLAHPFILRRMKTDPALVPDLPDKTDINAYCTLTPRQAALYKSQINALHAILDEQDSSQRLMLILPFLAKFKQICNHPDQFSGIGEYNTEESGKFIRLRELAGQIAERQEKLIIFTQFRAMMEPLHTLLASVYNRPGLILHGGTPVNERQKLVNTFQQEEGPPYFILSLKAAGTGLTLTQASHVIHFDRWWNPAVENQATDRAYRIGQHRNVLVHRLICKGTIEDKIDAMLRQKQKLSDNIFAEGIEKLLIDMSTEEIINLFSSSFH